MDNSAIEGDYALHHADHLQANAPTEPLQRSVVRIHNKTSGSRGSDVSPCFLPSDGIMRTSICPEAFIKMNIKHVCCDFPLSYDEMGQMSSERCGIIWQPAIPEPSGQR